MAASDPIEHRGGDFILRFGGARARDRVMVPVRLPGDELGPEAGETGGRAWIAANLAHVLGAATAIETGGIADEARERLLIAEVR